VLGSMDMMGLFLYRTAYLSGGFIGNTIGMGAAISVVMFALIGVGAGSIMLLLNKKSTELD